MAAAGRAEMGMAGGAGMGMKGGGGTVRLGAMETGRLLAASVSSRVLGHGSGRGLVVTLCGMYSHSSPAGWSTVRIHANVT